MPHHDACELLLQQTDVMKHLPCNRMHTAHMAMQSFAAELG